MEPVEFTEMVLRLTQVSLVLSDADRLAVLKVSYTIRKLLRQKVVAVLAEHRHDPTMITYMADGWGATVFQKFRAPLPGTHLIITRKGRYRHEFLLQRGLIRISPLAGGSILVPLIEQPLGLGLGKSAWNVFRASNDFFPSLRFSGQTGVVINLYLLDGGLYDSLERKFKGKHLLYYRCGLDLGDRALLLELSDWTLCILCPSHIMSNGLKWGISIVSDKEIIKAAHIATASCIAGSSAIHRLVDKFVFSHLHFTERRSGDRADIETYWAMLDVSGVILAQYTLYDLDFKDNALSVFTPRPQHVFPQRVRKDVRTGVRKDVRKDASTNY